MRVWILQTGEPLPGDRVALRPMRAMHLCQALRRRGHEVWLWSAAFHHQLKMHRYHEPTVVQLQRRLRLCFIASRGYCQNISLARFVDHLQLSWNLLRWLRQLDPHRAPLPDVAFVALPPLEAAAVLCQWLQARGVPVVLDVRDQWPEAFLKVVAPAWRPVARAALTPWFFVARRVMREADALCSMSPEFLAWAQRFSGRGGGFGTGADFVAPLAATRVRLSARVRHSSAKWWHERGVDLSHHRRLAFWGTLSRAFDFAWVDELVQRLQRSACPCEVVICGAGDAVAALQEQLARNPHVIFAGWVDAARVAVLARACVASVAPYRAEAAFQCSLPNKIVDSLAFGLPVLTQLGGAVSRLLHMHQVGYAGTSVAQMQAYVEQLVSSATLRRATARRARALWRQQFCAARVYGEVVQRLEVLAASAPQNQAVAKRALDIKASQP